MEQVADARRRRDMATGADRAWSVEHALVAVVAGSAAAWAVVFAVAVIR